MRGLIALIFLAGVIAIAQCGTWGGPCTHYNDYAKDDLSCGADNNMLCGKDWTCVCVDNYWLRSGFISGRKYTPAADKLSCQLDTFEGFVYV